MKFRVLFASVCLLLTSFVFSQTKSELPRVIRYSGTPKNADGPPRAGNGGLTFAICQQQVTAAIKASL